MQRLSLQNLWQQEFAHYDTDKFRQDLIAGLYVGASALPLALAFGFASGTSASLGLLTSILAGLIIGALGGSSYQISGATGVVSGLMMIVGQQYGLQGIWMVGVVSGVLLLLAGIFKVGRFVGFLPAPIIAGITSGIAVSIFVRQLSYLLGATRPEISLVTVQSSDQSIAHSSTLTQLFSFLQFNDTLDWRAVLIGVIVIITVLFWPQNWGKYAPGSLVGLIIASALTWIAGFNIGLIGDIPRSLLFENRFQLSQLDWQQIQELLTPILALTIVGAIAVLRAGKDTQKHSSLPLQFNSELIAQGIGNILIPFFGGIPASASTERTETALYAGTLTRIVSIVQAILLLLVMLILAPLLARIPVAAIAGLLMVLAWRMNDWKSIQFMFSHRFNTEMVVFAVMLLAMILLDLNLAIVLGALVSSIAAINRLSNLHVDLPKLEINQLKKRGLLFKNSLKGVRVVNLSGPLLFSNASQLAEAMAQSDKNVQVLILAIHDVPMIDSAGLETLLTLSDTLLTDNKTLLISGAQPNVLKMLEQAGLNEMLGKKSFFATTDQALFEADKRTGKQQAEDVEPSWNGTTALALFQPSSSTKEKGGKKRK